MKNLLPRLLLILLLAFIAFKAPAQTLTISGNGIATPLELSKGTFADMKQVVVMAKAHDDKIHRYSGVTIADLLARAGLPLGDSAKRKTISTYIIVTAADNYKAIYALPEIDPLFANRSIIIADRVDKKGLPAKDGPFQVIVPGEKKHARWVRQVTSIQVVKHSL